MTTTTTSAGLIATRHTLARRPLGGSGVAVATPDFGGATIGGVGVCVSGLRRRRR